ncbi:ATP-binding protein [Flagellimonas sp.]|uniref:ATP-binding protein n=1 Tax=Flagellimonas sp. TaxID=2058762 RepID=UPI003BAF8025
MKEHLLNLSNFLMVQKVCEIALRDSEFFGVIGDTGSGKSVALEHFKNQNHDVVKLIRVKPTMGMTDFFLELGALFGYRGSKKSKFIISNYLKEYCNSVEQQELLLLDEAARFRPHQLTFIQEIRDITQSKLGIVISGPHDFVRKLIKWDEKEIMGVAEFKRRVQLFKRMRPLEKKEIIAVCKEYGITERKIILQKFIKHDNIGLLTRAIKNYLKYGKDLGEI